MYKSVSMNEFEQKQKREHLNIIDVRETDEFAAGHVSGAVNVPLSVFAEKMNTLDKTKEYHIICQSGARSSRACEFLGNNEYESVNVMGGMSAWRGDVE